MLDKNRKKELLLRYKEMKSEMGVYMIKSLKTGKVYLGYNQDLKGTLNGERFKLNAGGHKNIELQKEWKENTEKDFEIKVLEILEYDKDESKTDYTEDLKVLRGFWKEKFENVEEI
ncbi:GIY-YIG nuclease family protein [Metaclostridioides mangenotii]|uniref:GIY-YIG nuclease family protein n=1 Tax=Metaclostridioides mangenotii TaxID=1540 RepID=UPI000481637C|nr:GIY-YIG nuclease family protein [Clostridioides mangenotii]